MDFCKLVGKYLESESKKNFNSDSKVCNGSNIDPLANFNAKKLPYININEYLDRFALYLKLDPSSFIVAMVLIQRVLELNPGSRLTPLNVHRLFAASVTIAEKIFSDFYWRNTDYAATGALSNEELNKLELEFMVATNFDLRITEKEYYECMAKIQERSNERKTPGEMMACKENGSEFENKTPNTESLVLLYN